MTRKHIHEEEFGISSDEMFHLLITPSKIRDWWGAARVIVLPEENGTWMAAWGENEDNPDYITAFTISAFEPPNRLLFTDAKYTASGEKLPFEAEMITEFAIKDNEIGCVLKVNQEGFPSDSSADEYFEGCKKGWTDTFAGIRKSIGTSL
ncbi:MAG: SRPBCC domain-containing protein [Pyrinomonadaceae bacterium]|nr:SRPBCC domain-containing protein [Pyrinomonadaceae bacterium]